jgi:cell division transport system permease protein
MRRSPYQAIAAILTLYITLLLTGIFSLATISSVVIMRYFESKPQLTIFFADRAGEKEAEALKSTLTATGKVAETKFVTKEDALTLYKEQNKNDPLLLEMVTSDILPASLEVTTSKPEYLAELEPIIQKAEGVEEVVFQKDIVESLLMWTRGARMFLGILVAFLSIDTILIIITITSMKIAIRRDEIEILRLVGASRSYIRSPFVIEGGIYGALSAILSWGTITSIIVVNRSTILSLLGIIPTIELIFKNILDVPFLGMSLGFLSCLIFVGFSLGALGSTIAVNRLLKG